MKIVDDAGNDLPQDGSVSGNMVVRGPWIVKGYMKGDGKSQFVEDDWFQTGDVCKIEADGSVVITDRSKDVIKSGGEWISSIDLENAAMGCPGVAEAAVIGVAHPKWDERPLLIVVQPARGRRHQGRHPEVPRRQDRQVVDARRRAVHRRHPARRHRQDPEDRAAQAVRGLQAADGLAPSCPTSSSPIRFIRTASNAWRRHPASRSIIPAPRTGEALVDRLRNADGLIVRGTPVDEALLAKAERLRVVCRHGVGYDLVDVPALTKRGIALMITPEANAASVAEHALTLMLNLARNVGPVSAAVRRGEWRVRGQSSTFELGGRQVLVFGFGRIGTRVARLCAAFGMRVMVHDPYLPAGTIRGAGYDAVVDRDAGLAQADIVTLHVPANDATRGMVNAAFLSRMKPGAVLVNTARGTLVDEAALEAALRSGHLGRRRSRRAARRTHGARAFHARAATTSSSRRTCAASTAEGSAAHGLGCRRQRARLPRRPRRPRRGRERRGPAALTYSAGAALRVCASSASAWRVTWTAPVRARPDMIAATR